MRTGTPSARPLSQGSREQNGRPCTTSMWNCIKRPCARNLEKTRRPIEQIAKIWEECADLKSPTGALANALEGTAQKRGLAQSSATSEL